MKKWWVGLLLMAVALVMIPATALAEKGAGNFITHYCPQCNEYKECEVVMDLTSEFISPTQHYIAYQCTECKYENWGEWEFHYGGSPTCSTAAECAGCGEGYKNPNIHTWVAANCQAPRTCSGCGATEGIADPNNHVGTLTDVNWLSIGDNNVHSVLQQCGACNGYVETKTEAHVPSFPANCAERAFCEKCKGYYGTTDPDNHDWGAWTYADANMHSRQCKRPECAKVETTPPLRRHGHLQRAGGVHGLPSSLRRSGRGQPRAHPDELYQRHRGTAPGDGGLRGLHCNRRRNV